MDKCKDDLIPVINAYIHAATARYPKIRYVLGGDAKILTFLASHMPDSILDYIFKKMTEKTGIIMPKALRKC